MNGNNMMRNPSSGNGWTRRPASNTAQGYMARTPWNALVCDENAIGCIIYGAFSFAAFSESFARSNQTLFFGMDSDTTSEVL